jgi:hypothetical protein
VTDPRQPREEFEPDLVSVAERLERERPLPSPGFRGELKRHLMRKEERMTPAISPVALKRRIAGLATSGGVLLAIAGAGALGLGPLAS